MKRRSRPLGKVRAATPAKLPSPSPVPMTAETDMLKTALAPIDARSLAPVSRSVTPTPSQQTAPSAPPPMRSDLAAPELAPPSEATPQQATTPPQDLSAMISELLKKRSSMGTAEPMTETAQETEAPVVEAQPAPPPQKPIRRAQIAKPFAKLTIPAGVENVQPVVRPPMPRGTQRIATATPPKRTAFSAGVVQAPQPMMRRFALPLKIGDLFESFRRTLI